MMPPFEGYAPPLEEGSERAETTKIPFEGPRFTRQERQERHFSEAIASRATNKTKVRQRTAVNGDS
jgi:hypothetical protein